MRELRYGLTALVFLLVAGTLLSYSLQQPLLIYLCKPLASGCFIALGALGWARASHGSPYGSRVLWGLVLGAGGDVALMFSGRAAFLSGLVLFLLGHLCYCAAFVAQAPLRRWLQPALFPLLLVSGAVSLWLFPHVPGPLRGPVAAYIMVISAMVAGGLGAYRQGRPGRGHLLAGALLFYLSDLAVANQRFVAPSLWNGLVGLPLYYLAQVLLAWSIYPPSCSPFAAGAGKP